MPAAEILAVIRAAGHDPASFFDSRPGVSYRRLARELDVVPIDLMWAHASLAHLLGARAIAKDSLVRLLREHLPGGWDAAQAHEIGAFVFWRAMFRFPELARFAGAAEAVERALLAAAPRTAWKPKSPNDPLLEQAFQVAFDRVPGIEDT